MKRVMIGGFFSLVGMLGVIAVYVVGMTNMVSSWNNPPGRFLSTVSEFGMTALFALSWFSLITGIVVMAIEYFRKESK